ncbi:hypothetical protein BAUCODRAFT_23790 [Baudoinia panamericana UAMH 10762]|uniref:DUF431 domain-containing protein n=1 Tax=Baudoinia panamericana (strain UAMH 10762) TaxID=717646 RepID=M2NE76_BAUPA|nr:uncharacterized protein BAUCODRAFT_23790 [Baudoinia panamericana UAMH 10762]EMC97514.1 hypothetical protein BAUCODRAFT_23790 [Baudoinia panamericana UAMH 10762]
MATKPPTKHHTFIIEHLDPELEAWQALEYKCIYRECHATNCKFILSGLADADAVRQHLDLPSESLQQQSVESIYATSEARAKVCLLDPKAEKDISPEDGDLFDAFLFGGILGDDPPRGTAILVVTYEDRTSELRSKGFPGRRLGPEQMTTDTAARVTRIVVQERKRLEEISFIDRPDIELPAATNADGSKVPSESVSMPFKYVKGADGKPIMPEGMLQLLVDDMDKGIEDLL